jgi:copper chaperone NosL
MTRRHILLLMLLIGCATDTSGPVEPVWGKQPCAHCMMLVSERAPAAQLITKAGARRFFDDVGCMAEWLEANRDDASMSWVRGADGNGWQSAQTARFAGAQRTPMDYGFVPAATGIDFQTVRQAVRTKARERAEAP